MLINEFRPSIRKQMHLVRKNCIGQATSDIFIWLSPAEKGLCSYCLKQLCQAGASPGSSGSPLVPQAFLLSSSSQTFWTKILVSVKKKWAFYSIASCLEEFLLLLSEAAASARLPRWSPLLSPLVSPAWLSTSPSQTFWTKLSKTTFVKAKFAKAKSAKAELAKAAVAEAKFAKANLLKITC